MRRTAVSLLLFALLLAGCGGGGPSKPAAGTLDALLARPGPDVALVQGTSDYAVGRAPRHLPRDRQPGAPDPAAARTGARRHFARFAAAGRDGRATSSRSGSRASRRRRPAACASDLRRALPARQARQVHPRRRAERGRDPGHRQPRGRRRARRRPAVGDRAIPSRTPTLESTHGDVAVADDGEPARPVAAPLLGRATRSQAHVPFVLVFATPKFCESRTCGPVVDVVKAVQRRFAGSGVRFIHVEIYTGQQPRAGANRWVKEWRLPSEPLVFLVGGDGRIKARFEGCAVVELAASSSPVRRRRTAHLRTDRPVRRQPTIRRVRQADRARHAPAAARRSTPPRGSRSSSPGSSRPRQRTC